MNKLQDKMKAVQNELQTALSEKIIDYEKSLSLEVKVKLAHKDILDLSQKLKCSSHDLAEKRREYLAEVEIINQTLKNDEYKSLYEIMKLTSSIN